MEKGVPHTHSTGISLGIPPYRRAKASQRAPLCREKPCSHIERELNHKEAPFSCTNSTAWLRSLDSSGRKTYNSHGLEVIHFVLMYRTSTFYWEAQTSNENSGDWSKRKENKGEDKILRCCIPCPTKWEGKYWDLQVWQVGPTASSQGCLGMPVQSGWGCSNQLCVLSTSSTIVFFIYLVYLKIV